MAKLDFWPNFGKQHTKMGSLNNSEGYIYKIQQKIYKIALNSVNLKPPSVLLLWLNFYMILTFD